MKGIYIRVYGKVQGVWFRASAKREADRLRVCGSVRNHADGSVHIQAVGDQSTLDKFLQWCHQGPQHARVERVEVNPWEVDQPYNQFTVIR